jgi:hypothetical protein
MNGTHEHDIYYDEEFERILTALGRAPASGFSLD